MELAQIGPLLYKYILSSNPTMLHCILDYLSRNIRDPRLAQVAMRSIIFSDKTKTKNSLSCVPDPNQERSAAPSPLRQRRTTKYNRDI